MSRTVFIQPCYHGLHRPHGAGVRVLPVRSTWSALGTNRSNGKFDLCGGKAAAFILR